MTCLAVLAFPAAGLADHVAVSGQASAELGERFSATSWKVVVRWSAMCTGDSGAVQYYGDLKLVDLGTQEEIYLGGVSGSGDMEVLVGRRQTDRRLVPVLRISCSISQPDGATHGDGPIEVSGVAVVVPAAEGTGGGGGGGGGGGSGGPGGLPAGACANVIRGSAASETILGTAGNDAVRALGGNDTVRGRAGHDCLRGGGGNDRLEGEAGSDGLYGGSGADVLVGGSGRNVYEGGGGNDVIRAANGRAEVVKCGTGSDRARVDAGDQVHGCEAVTRA